MKYRRLYNPTITQRGIQSTFVPETYDEIAVCPFCQHKNIGNWLFNDLRPPEDACNHFRGFVSGGGTSIVANFSGPANLVDEESE